jgi:hypothetical protein
MLPGEFQRVITAAAAGLFLAACGGEPPSPATPPLLRDVSAQGGWWNGGCPPRDAAEARLNATSPEALSPELTERLAQEFAVGSDAGRLERALRDQGFQVRAPCATVPAIRLAEFRQTGGGFYGPYPVFAQVAWEQDDAGRLVWAKGHVAFTGP